MKAKKEKEMEEQKTEVKESTKKEITIYDLPGVGAATATKLEEAGYNTLKL